MQLTITASFLKYSVMKNFIVHNSLDFWEYKDISARLIN